MIASTMLEQGQLPRRLFISSGTCLASLALIGCQLPGGGQAAAAGRSADLME